MNSSHPFLSKLIDLELSGKRAWEKFIPNQYLYSSVEDRVALLQGLMDTVHQNMQSILAAQNQNHEMALQNQAAQHAQLLQHLTKPKQVVRDPNTGKIIGVK